MSCYAVANMIVSFFFFPLSLQCDCFIVQPHLNLCFLLICRLKLSVAAIFFFLQSDLQDDELQPLFSLEHSLSTWLYAAHVQSGQFSWMEEQHCFIWPLSFYSGLTLWPLFSESKCFSPLCTCGTYNWTDWRLSMQSYRRIYVYNTSDILC